MLGLKLTSINVVSVHATTIWQSLFLINCHEYKDYRHLMSCISQESGLLLTLQYKHAHTVLRIPFISFEPIKY